MKRSTNRSALVVSVIAAIIAMSGTALAQDEADTSKAVIGLDVQAATDRAQPAPIEVQHFRPHDARGINMFEPPKEPGVPYTGFKIQWGAAFTQQWQALHHSNNAARRTVPPDTTNANQLIEIGSGFNNAEANLYMDTQIAKGIRVEMTSYLSSRHHNETWVKDGYFLMDGSPWENATLDQIMKYVTLRIGHFEINYGDAHFRRSDNGNAMYNPLVGNLLMDAFTTEVGAEAYVRSNGLMGMFGVTNGEIRGTVRSPQQRAPAYLGKVGFDRMVTPDVRVRVTGSIYNTTKSANNTLYSGSRSGSRYYDVLENTKASATANAWSGDVQPGQSSKLRAWVINPFVTAYGFEFFGNYEESKGRTATETDDRTWKQMAVDGVYRFLRNQLYVAARYNTAKGKFVGFTDDVTVERTQAGGGWFITRNLEMKAEYVKQIYKDFPVTDIRSGGKFEGMMVEGVVAF